jgi:predicted ATPase
MMDSQPEFFARHYTEAGLAEKSVFYWSKAARRSAARSAMAEAAAQFQKGLDQLTLLPDDFARQRQELEFRSSLGTVLQSVKGYAAPETGQTLARARELWERLGSPSEFLQVSYAQSLYHAIRGELNLAHRLDKDLLRLSRQRNDPAGLVLAHQSLGRNLMFAGRFAASRSHLEETLALCDSNSDPSLVWQAGVHPQVASQAFFAIVLFCLGHPGQALARSTAAIAEARRLAHAPSLAVSLTNGTRLLSFAGNDATFEEWASQLATVATEQGFLLWRAIGTIYSGWLKVKNGEVAEGILLLRSGAAAYRATGAEAWVPYQIALLARACEIAGQIEEAVDLLDDALQVSKRTGERWLDAELNRHKGRLLLRQGHSGAAEELYRKALSIAAEQEAKLWELRAAASSPGSAATRAATSKPATSSRPSTAGSPRASTPPTSKKQRRCWTSCEHDPNEPKRNHSRLSFPRKRRAVRSTSWFRQPQAVGAGTSPAKAKLAGDFFPFGAQNAPGAVPAGSHASPAATGTS